MRDDENRGHSMSSRSTSFLNVWSLLRGCILLSSALLRAEPQLTVHGTPRLAPPIMPRYHAPEFVPTDFVATSLETVPGVMVTDLGGPGQLSTISFRALSSKDTLVVLDGVPLNGGGAFGTFDFAHLLSGSVRSRTLIPGANSVHYGDGATGGVVLLETPFTSYNNGVTAINIVRAISSG